MQTSPGAGGQGPDRASDDQALLSAAARGDERAYEQLLDRYASASYGLAVRVVRDPEMARDVTQEALLHLWAQAARFDASRGSVRSWIFTLVHRRAVDRIRSEQASSDRVHRVGPAEYERAHDHVSADVERKFEIRRVRNALGDLTPLQREAIELAYYRGFTHSQVAAALEIPVGTAKTRLRDGLIRLRDALGVDS